MTFVLNHPNNICSSTSATNSMSKSLASCDKLIPCSIYMTIKIQIVNTISYFLGSFLLTAT